MNVFKRFINLLKKRKQAPEAVKLQHRNVMKRSAVKDTLSKRYSRNRKSNRQISNQIRRSRMHRKMKRTTQQSMRAHERG